MAGLEIAGRVVARSALEQKPGLSEVLRTQHPASGTYGTNGVWSEASSDGDQQ